MVNILLVDDDLDLQDTLKECLELEGYAVETAGDGAAALALMQSRPYHVVILDWQMPSVSGLEVCRAYRQSGGCSRILMLSGQRDAADRDEGLQAGVDLFLTKPFSIDKLMTKLKEVLAG